MQTGNQDICQIDVRSGTATRFTFHPSADISPVWSPDASQIAFSSFREGAGKVYLKAASGAGDSSQASINCYLSTVPATPKRSITGCAQ